MILSPLDKRRSIGVAEAARVLGIAPRTAATSTSTTADDDAAAATTTTTTTADALGNTDDDAPDNNNDDPTAPPTDPTNVDNTVAPPTSVVDISIGISPLDAIQSQAITDPRGGSAPADFPDTGATASGAPIPPGEAAPTPVSPPVNIEIDAVIVSAAQSPWDAIINKRAPGVGTITIVGGIVALGKTPIEGEFPGGGPQPPWLRVIPDLALLNGSKIPPVVPNVIDIRWMNCPIQVEEEPNDSN